MKIQPVELTGKRAKLIPMEQIHVKELYEAGNDKNIWYMPMDIKTPEDMEQLVENALRDRRNGSAFPFVIMDQDSGKIVGSTRFLDISAANRGLEIGWTWLSPTVWRTRINTECKYLLLQDGFESLKTIRVQLKTDERNIRSQKAIQRLGAVKEGTLRNHRILRDGYYRNTVYFSIIDSEWPQVKKRLLGFLEALQN
ncbi:MAG TPA: GNAT family protein [Bacillales bacterium]|nr:GNAT family protein [Bacillales bacterium]